MPRKEGFEAYYDQIVPQAANKLGKQWGAKVGETEIETGDKYQTSPDGYQIPIEGSGKKTVPYLPITPQMRVGVKSIPYSLFTIPLAATGLALSQGKANASPAKRGTIEVTDPNGHKHYFLDERSASAFRKAAGIQ
jgi:hypothetical protein